MALAQAEKSHETTYTLDDAMDILLTKLDDAIHDMETGRVQYKVVDKSAATITVLRILQDGMDWENIIRQWISRKH